MDGLLASSIVDLTAGEYWMAFGPPCENDYEPLPWRLYSDWAVEDASPRVASSAAG